MSSSPGLTTEQVFARGGAAVVVSCRHTCPHPVHRYRRTVISSVVGRHPNGSRAIRRATVRRVNPRDRPGAGTIA